MTTAHATGSGKLYETQKERWVKYGANVGLTIVIAIALAVLVTYLAQRFSRRVDTTASGAYSLKPQTVNLIKNNKSDIKIVSLYTTKEPHDPATMAAQDQADRIQAVNDLLDEYKRKGNKIDVDWVDPRTN